MEYAGKWPCRNDRLASWAARSPKVEVQLLIREVGIKSKGDYLGGYEINKFNYITRFNRGHGV